MNYVVYHLHTYYSLLDSTTSFYKYVDNHSTASYIVRGEFNSARREGTK